MGVVIVVLLRLRKLFLSFYRGLNGWLMAHVPCISGLIGFLLFVQGFLLGPSIQPCKKQATSLPCILPLPT